MICEFAVYTCYHLFRSQCLKTTDMMTLFLTSQQIAFLLSTWNSKSGFPFTALERWGKIWSDTHYMCNANLICAMQFLRQSVCNQVLVVICVSVSRSIEPGILMSGRPSVQCHIANPLTSAQAEIEGTGRIKEKQVRAWVHVSQFESSFVRPTHLWEPYTGLGYLFSTSSTQSVIWTGSSIQYFQYSVCHLDWVIYSVLPVLSLSSGLDALVALQSYLGN